MGLHSETVKDHDDRGLDWMARAASMTTVHMDLLVSKEAFYNEKQGAWR